MNTTKSVPNDFQVQKGTTWLGGPTHVLQKQQIPGYSGHIKGLYAENIHGKNFARVTGECLNDRNPKGIDLSVQQKFLTSYTTQFNKPDLRRNQLRQIAQKLVARFEAEEHAINQSMIEQFRKQPKSIQDVAPIDRIPVVGYQGFKPVFRPQQKQVKAVQQPSKIQLLELKILREMLQSGHIDQQVLKKMQKKEPVVGYAGFLKGVKAQNNYGTSFNNLARKSFQK